MVKKNVVNLFLRHFKDWKINGFMVKIICRAAHIWNLLVIKELVAQLYII